MEDLGKSADEGIELKPKKPRSEAQLKAFEKAREIRLENAKLKKEKIAQVKEEVKNRTRGQSATQPLDKVVEPIPAKTTFEKVGQNIEGSKGSKAPFIDETAKIKKELKEKKIIEEDSEEEVVVVKKKKKPKVIYVEESDEEPQPVVIKKKKEEPVHQGQSQDLRQPVLVKPIQSIRFF